MKAKTKKTFGKLSAPTKPVIRTFFIDENGDNKVMVKSTPKTKTIHLMLKGENRKRLVGTITKSTRTITIKRKKQEHLFRAGNAYGFNAYVLREAKDFDTVMLSDEFNHWKFPVKFVLDHGKHLLFSQVGYELQLFVSMEQLEPYKVRPVENRRF